jgi:hypothetical protein
MATDTIPALEAFVKKNPNSPLVKTAEREREKIAQRLEEEATGRGATPARRDWRFIREGEGRPRDFGGSKTLKQL